MTDKPDFYSVERRFDLTTIFVVTSACAILYGICGAAGWNAGFPTSIIGYIAVVGLGQAFLFGGKKPRLASLLVGAVLLLAIVFIPVAMWRRITVEMMISQGIFVVGFGCLFGYCAGTVAAGAFYVAAQLRTRSATSLELDEERSFDDLES